jgi:hypothetical protein
MIAHKSLQELTNSLSLVKLSPNDNGRLERIVRRPDVEAREVIVTGQLDIELGLIGDNWKTRGSKKSADGSALPGAQITLMNSRVAAALAGGNEHWELAGDQLFVELDLSEENLPPGTHLAIGEALLEITDLPHTGCAKFAERFGKDALKFVSTQAGRAMRLRGVYAKVIRAGAIRAGDNIRKVLA